MHPKGCQSTHHQNDKYDSGRYLQKRSNHEQRLLVTKKAFGSAVHPSHNGGSGMAISAQLLSHFYLVPLTSDRKVHMCVAYTLQYCRAHRVDGYLAPYRRFPVPTAHVLSSPLPADHLHVRAHISPYQATKARLRQIGSWGKWAVCTGLLLYLLSCRGIWVMMKVARCARINNCKQSLRGWRP